MLERFRGTEGKARLALVLAENRLVVGNPAIALRMAEFTKAEELPEGKQIYMHGETGRNVLYLVLSGSVDLSAQGKHVATLGRGQFVGEFPILDPTTSYIVTVVAREKSWIATISEREFLRLTDEYPEIWKNMAKELAGRLSGVRTPSQQIASLSSPKTFQEAIVSLIYKLPRRQSIAVLIALAAVAFIYFAWTTLPDQNRSDVVNWFRSLLSTNSSATAPAR